MVFSGIFSTLIKIMKQWQLIWNGSLNFFDQGDAKNITMKKVIKKTFFSFRYPRSYQIVFPNKWLSVESKLKGFKDFKDASEMHWKSVYSVNNFLFVANDIYTGHYNSTPAKNWSMVWSDELVFWYPQRVGNRIESFSWFTIWRSSTLLAKDGLHIHSVRSKLFACFFNDTHCCVTQRVFGF